MYKKELSYYFSSPIAYIVIGLYQLAISLFLWVIPGQWNIIDSGYAQVDGLFQLSPWLMMLLCPALTMRLLSEERQSGIWDLIRTKPISLSRIMFGKYFAASNAGLLLISILWTLFGASGDFTNIYSYLYLLPIVFITLGGVLYLSGSAAKNKDKN